MNNNSQNYSKKERLQEWLLDRKRQLKKNVNIIRELVKKNVKIQYRNSAIGAVWTILNPLLNMLVMFFVFGTILGYGNDPTYALYLLCGNIIFNTMRGATTQSLTTLVQNRGLLTKNRISYSVFPIANNLTAFVNFLFSCVALLGVMIIVHFSTFGELPGSIFGWQFFMMLLMLPALFLFTYGVSLLLSAMYVFFRDIQHFYTVFLTLWTYLTPIFYKTDRFTTDNTMEKLALFAIEKLNPMYYFVTYFRNIVYHASAYGELLGNGGAGISLWTLYFIGLVFMAIGSAVFVLTKRKFIFYI